MYDIIIIGAGPAGIYGTYYATFNGLKVLLLEVDNEIGGKPLKFYAQKPVHDFPGFKNITGEELIKNFIEQLHSLKDKNLYEIKTNIDIISIDNINDKFILKDINNNQYESKYLIFATGYSSFKFKTIDHEKIKTKNKINFHVDNIANYSNKNVVICGGGDSAIDYANLLSSVAKSINIIHRSHNFKAHKSSLELMQKNKNIIINSNYSIQEINDKSIVIKNNENNEYQNILYDEIIVCYGIEMLQNHLSKLGILNKIFKLEVNQNCESINYKNMYGVGNINNKKNKDLLLIAIAEIVNVVIEIMEKENIKLTYH